MSVNATHSFTPVFHSFPIDQLQPQKLEKFLHSLLASSQTLDFQSTEIYSHFLTTVCEKTGPELCAQALAHFRKVRKFPRNFRQSDVALVIGTNPIFSCPKELLYQFPSFAELLQQRCTQISLELSEQAARAFETYLYEGTIDENALLELLPFAKRLGCPSFLDDVSKKYTEYLVDPQNETAFDPDRTPIDRPLEFALCFFKKRHVTAKVTRTQGLQIKLSSFISHFQNRNAKILAFVAYQIDVIEVDTDQAALLHLIPQRFKKHVVCINFDNAPSYDLCYLKEIKTQFRNAAFSVATKIRATISPTTKDAFGLALQGYLLGQQGELKQAAKKLYEALRLDPRDSNAHGWLGEILDRQGQVNVPATELESALEWDPKNALANGRLGAIRHKEGNLQEAHSYLQEAVRLYPKYAFARGRLGDVLRRQGRCKEAEEELLIVLRHEPNDAFARGRLGDVLRQQGRCREAKEELLIALRHEPNDAFISTVLAEVLRELREFDAAERTARQVISLHPKYTSARVTLGTILKQQGKPAGAEEVFREAIRCNARDATARAMLGDILMIQGNLSQAETELQIALTLNSKHSFAIETLAEVERLKQEELQARMKGLSLNNNSNSTKQ